MTSRRRGLLIAVHLAHNSQNGSCREQKRQGEPEQPELHDFISIHTFDNSARLRRRALPITDTELNVIAALAIEHSRKTKGRPRVRRRTHVPAHMGHDLPPKYQFLA